jgi:hypothetical protein
MRTALRRRLVRGLPRAAARMLLRRANKTATPAKSVPDAPSPLIQILQAAAHGAAHAIVEDQLRRQPAPPQRPVPMPHRRGAHTKRARYPQ